MTLTKKQRLEAYMDAYLCLLAGFDEYGEDVYGFPKQYICDYLLEWTEEELGNKNDDQQILFPEWYALKPKTINSGDGLGWWPQGSKKRHMALKKVITECEKKK